MRICHACSVMWAGRTGCWLCGRWGAAILPKDTAPQMSAHHHDPDALSTVETLEPLVDVAGV